MHMEPKIFKSMGIKIKGHHIDLLKKLMSSGHNGIIICESGLEGGMICGSNTVNRASFKSLVKQGLIQYIEGSEEPIKIYISGIFGGRSSYDKIVGYKHKYKITDLGMSIINSK